MFTILLTACWADPAAAARVTLTRVASDLPEPTDIQAYPDTDELVVLTKGGDAFWIDPQSGSKQLWFHTDVATPSECGLLGIAFAPPKFYTYQCEETDQGLFTEVVAWTVGADRHSAPVRGDTLLRISQPYNNHDGGQIRFGPDGMLYVGVGDGGSAGDPHGNGQNLDTPLGKLLRIDVSTSPYTVPKDNPFVDRPGARPEIWAYGLRNPWRFAFAPDGSVIVADVGQDTWEEVDRVRRGDNLGWNTREGAHCYDAKACATEGLVEPIFEYDHGTGVSITGGVFWDGRFLVADFATGRLFALDIPADGPAVATDLGRLGITPSTFGLANDGRVYVADYSGSAVYRLESR